MQGKILAEGLFEPPAKADEKKAIVAHELGRFAFVIVSDELKDPAEDKEYGRSKPNMIHKEADGQQDDCDCDHRNAESVRQTVYGMLVRLLIFLDPVVPASAAHHKIFVS